MKVLYWSDLFWPHVGGAEVLAANLLPALKDQGCQITVLTSFGNLDLPHRDDLDGIPIYRLPMLRALSADRIDMLPEVVEQIKRLKRDFAPDLIHLGGIGPTSLLCLKTASSNPAPLIVTLHTEVLAAQRDPHQSLFQQVLRNADWVTSVSASALQQARQTVPAIIGRSSVVHNYVDVPPQVPSVLPCKYPSVLCLGRLISAKGFDLALRAFASVLPGHKDAKLVIAGEGPEKTNLQQIADRLGIRSKVRFVGAVAPQDVWQFLSAATVVLMPSRREGLPMAAIEAGLMSRPIVATDAGGLSEVVVDGQTGILVEKEDVDALARALDTLLRQTELASRLGRNAQIRASSVFTRQRCVDAYVGVYRKLSRDLFRSDL